MRRVFLIQSDRFFFPFLFLLLFLLSFLSILPSLLGGLLLVVLAGEEPRIME